MVKKLDWKNPECRAYGPGPWPILPLTSDVHCPKRGGPPLAPPPIPCWTKERGYCQYYSGVKGTGLPDGLGKGGWHLTIFCRHPGQEKALREYWALVDARVAARQPPAVIVESEPKPARRRLVEPEIPIELQVDEEKEETGQLSLF